MNNHPPKNLKDNLQDRVVAAGPQLSSSPLDEIIDKESHEVFDNHYKFFEAQDLIVAKDIEYKLVDIDVFTKDGYKAVKQEVQYSDEGYITDDLLSKIEIAEENTVVINVATGSGKTTAIYRLVKEIIESDPESIIIMATPFIALVEKDELELTTNYEINSDLITNYKKLSETLVEEKSPPYGFRDPAWIVRVTYIEEKRIHITTINGLLRNPGDVAFSQKIEKTNYFEGLHEYCLKSHKRVYLFLDEIHASIHNFKNEYIYFLTMWKDVIHKCIVSTATYTEPVYIAIKHFALLTDDNIQVLEAPRIKAKTVSPLDMVFYPHAYNPSYTKQIREFIKAWIRINASEKSTFHILSYSKKLAKALHGMFGSDFGKINLFTSETKKKNVVFNEKINSLGTNFATGVDIKDEERLLIIIFPVKYSEELIKGEEGIFSDGLPSILQAIARLRSRGRILFVIPPLKGIIKDDPTITMLNKIPFYYKEEWKNNPDDKDAIKIMKESFLHEENSMLKSYIESKLRLLSDKIEEYHKILNDDNRQVNRPVIQVPDENTFILERGQEFLKFISYKSGKYITPYVVWAAVNDQYINCKLDKVYYHLEKKHNLNLNSPKITKNIFTFLKKYLNSGYFKADFTIFYEEACKLFKNIYIEENNTISTLNVTIFLDGEPIDFSKLRVKNEFFFSLVSIYLDLKSNIILDRESYIKYAVETQELYVELKRIKDLFLKNHLGEKYQFNEIENLPIFKDIFTIEALSYNLELINKQDDVLNLFVKECKRDPISTGPNNIIRSFITNFIKRGPELRGGKREIMI